MSEPETKATVLKWLARGIGTLLGLLGGLMTFFAAAAFFSAGTVSGPTPAWLVPLLGLILLMLGGTLLRTAFLVWFRWSPAAARRLLQAACFIVLVWAVPIVGNLSNFLVGLLLLAVLGIGALLTYRRTAEYFCLHAFGNPRQEEPRSSDIGA